MARQQFQTTVSAAGQRGELDNEITHLQRKNMVLDHH